MVPGEHSVLSNGMHRSQVGYCAWCGQALLRKPVADDHGVKYHVACLAQLRAILAKADQDTPFIIRALRSGTACLPCLVTTTGLLEPEIISALRRLRTDIDLGVGSCSRCGAEARLLCGLAAA
jgi:hypothetical protein